MEVRMRHTHLASGGRYPVLRSVAILCLVSAVVALGDGVWRALDTLVRAPDVMEGRGVGAERQGVAAMAAAASAVDAAVAADGNGKPATVGGRMTFLEGEETAEGAL